MKKMRVNRRWFALSACLIAVALWVALGPVFNDTSHPQPPPTSQVPSPGTISAAPLPPVLPHPSQEPKPRGLSAHDIDVIKRTAGLFVAAAYSYRYTDAPNAAAMRTKPYMTPEFTGILPRQPDPSSNAGMRLQASRTTATAALAPNGVRFDLTETAKAMVTVEISVTTASASQPTSSITFHRVLMMVKNGDQWLVDRLSEE